MCTPWPDHWDSGLLYDEVAQLDKAVEDYTRAIKLVPGDEAFFYSRGHAYFRLNKDDLAIADLTAAIRLQPKLSELYFWRGFSFERTKKYIEAKQDFTRVIASENDPAVLGEVYDCSPIFLLFRVLQNNSL